LLESSKESGRVKSDLFQLREIMGKKRGGGKIQKEERQRGLCSSMLEPAVGWGRGSPSRLGKRVEDLVWRGEKEVDGMFEVGKRKKNKPKKGRKQNRVKIDLKTEQEKRPQKEDFHIIREEISSGIMTRSPPIK